MARTNEDATGYFALSKSNETLDSCFLRDTLGMGSIHGLSPVNSMNCSIVVFKFFSSHVMLSLALRTKAIFAYVGFFHSLRNHPMKLAAPRATRKHSTDNSVMNLVVVGISLYIKSRIRPMYSSPLGLFHVKHSLLMKSALRIYFPVS